MNKEKDISLQSNNKIMKKKFGEWLLDVSKYIVTVGFIAPFVRNVDEWPVAMIVSIFVLVILLVVTGLTLSQDKSPQKQKKNQKS